MTPTFPPAGTIVLSVLACVLGGYALRGQRLTESRGRETTCGPLCLTFCAVWLGTQATVREVEKSSGMDEKGVSLWGLGQAARRVVLERRTYTLSLADLHRVTPSTPAIAHVDRNHFVVVWMMRPDEVTVIEPHFTLSHTSLRKFGRRWDGNILVISRPGQ